MHRVQKPLCLIHFWVIPFFSFSPLWGNKKWAPQYEDEEVGKLKEQNQLNRLQMVQFECTGYRNPCWFVRKWKLLYVTFGIKGFLKVAMTLRYRKMWTALEVFRLETEPGIIHFSRIIVSNSSKNPFSYFTGIGYRIRIPILAKNGIITPLAVILKV